MLKNILNHKGAQQLNKNEQSEINGGKIAPICDIGSDCGPGGCWFCRGGRCFDYCD